MSRENRYQVSGVPGYIHRTTFGDRIVDFWSPEEKSSHVLVAHDGQNVFDHRTATRHRTWKMAQSAIHMSAELGITAPTIIAVFHSGTKENPWGRLKDLAPQDPFQNEVRPASNTGTPLALEELKGNDYLALITEEIVPRLVSEIGLDIDALDKAIIGSSMGGLASLYALGKRPDFFSTALALSTHWLAGGEPLVNSLVDLLPAPGHHNVWMSHGTRGHDALYGPLQKVADEHMRKAGWIQNKDFISKVYKKSGHNERSWARYLDQPMKFWLTSNAKFH